MNRIKKFLGYLLVVALVICLSGQANAFPTHRGNYRFNELCEKVKKGDWIDFRGDQADNLRKNLI